MDYFSCNPLVKPTFNAVDIRYTISSLRLQILFRKSRLDRTAGASNRDPMCKMAFPYVTYGQRERYIYIYSNSLNMSFFSISSSLSSFSFETGTAMIQGIRDGKKIRSRTLFLNTTSVYIF